MWGVSEHSFSLKVVYIKSKYAVRVGLLCADCHVVATYSFYDFCRFCYECILYQNRSSVRIETHSQDSPKKILLVVSPPKVFEVVVNIDNISASLISA